MTEIRRIGGRSRGHSCLAVSYGALTCAGMVAQGRHAPAGRVRQRPTSAPGRPNLRRMRPGEPVPEPDTPVVATEPTPPTDDPASADEPTEDRSSASPFSTASLPALVVGLASVALFLVWAQRGGRYEPTVWLPGALLFLGLLVAILLGSRVDPRLPTRPFVALVSLVALAAWSFVSMLWADVPGDAWIGANRMFLVATVFAVFLLVPWTPVVAQAVVWALAGCIAVVAGHAIWLVSTTEDDAFFINSQLSYPTEYPNATVALFLIGFWLALPLAVRRDQPVVVRALATGAVVFLPQAMFVVQNRAVFVAVPLTAAILVLVGGCAVDVRRERQVPRHAHRVVRAAADEPHPPLAVPEHRHRLHLDPAAERDAPAGTERAARLPDGRPAPVRLRADEQDLGRRPRGPRAEEPRVPHPRGVEDQEVAGGEQRGEVAEGEVTEGGSGTRPAPGGDQQPALPPLPRGMLGDQLGREGVLVVRGEVTPLSRQRGCPARRAG